jgi:hypothetical protein
MLSLEDQVFVEARKKQIEATAAMSDEEWWEEIVAQTREIRPEMIEVFERSKAMMIENRHKPAIQGKEFREKMIQRKAQELMPFVMELRLERGSTSSLTKDEYQIASMRMSGEASKSVPAQMEASAKTLDDPRKRVILEQFVRNGKQDLVELESLHDLDHLTEEKLVDVTNGIAQRFDQLTEWMKSNRSQN